MQPAERADVLVVVADDLGQLGGRRPARKREVAAGDLPAVDVADPLHPEELGLGGPQPGIGHPVPEEAADDRQQVEVTGMPRRGPAGHPEARRQQRPVEPTPVVGDEPGSRAG